MSKNAVAELVKKIEAGEVSNLLGELTAVIEAASADAVAKETDGLKRKRDELLAQIYGTEDKPGILVRLQELEARWKGIDPEEAKQAIELKERLLLEGDDPDPTKQKNAPKLETYDKLKEKWDGKLESVKSEYEEKLKSSTSFIERLLIDQGLRTQLVELGVRPELMDGAVALLRPLMAVSGDGPNSKAVAKTDAGEIPMEDHLKEWIDTEIGLAYKAATESGGGHDGGRAPAKPKEDAVNPWMRSSLNLTKQAEILRSDPQKAERMKAEAVKVNKAQTPQNPPNRLTAVAG